MSLCLLAGISILCIGAVSPSNSMRFGLEQMQADELNAVIGGMFEECDGSSTCDTSYNTCSTEGVGCDSHLLPEPWCETENADRGCSESGSWTICTCDWWGSCDDDGGDDQCGDYKYPSCQESTYGQGVQCNGFCDDNSSDPCKNDCL